MSVIGINAKKHFIFVAATDGGQETFKVVGMPLRLDFDLEPRGLERLVSSVRTILDEHRAGLAAPVKVGVLSCLSGPRGSSREAIKAEALCELAVVQTELELVRVAPQGLAKFFHCPKGVPWSKQAASRLNPERTVRHWSDGMDGAVSVAYRVACQQ
jgi:hypothetical protein